MPSLLRTLPILVLAVAAAESILVRIELPHRPTEIRLFLQAALLWFVLGGIACLPAWATLRLRRARPSAEEEPRRSLAPAPALVLLGWMVGPVLVHTALDRHIGLEGNLAGLHSILPWLEAGVILLVMFLALFGLSKLGRKVKAAPLGLGLVLVSVVTGLFLPWRPDAVGAAPDTAGQPNLLLVVWDTLRADRIQPYGYDRATTPHLERFAEESMVFDDVRSVSCFTFSSHLSLLTGVYPSTHGARLISSLYDPRRAEHVADILRRAGYRTGAFVGTDVLAARTGIRYGFEVYDDQVDPPVCDTLGWKLVHDAQAVLARLVPALRNNGRPHWIQDFQRPADQVLRRAAAWIDDDDPRPWFCLVNVYDVHWPYLPGDLGRDRLVRPYAGPLDGFLFRSDAWRDGYAMQEEDARHVSDLYDGEILDLDRAMDAFLAELGLEEGTTAVVMTSDHGEAFGEAGRWKHADILEPQVRVPLMIRPAAANPEGSRVAERVSGVDVAPTLLGLAGLGPPKGAEGIDLLGGTVPADRRILVEDRDHLDPKDVRVGWYRGPWKLVRRGLGDEAVFELFDLRVDPVGEHDVSTEHPDVLEELGRELGEHRAKADAEDAEGAEELRHQADALRALGYGG